MAASQSVNYSLIVRATKTDTLDIGTAVDSVNKTYSDSLTNGTADNMADLMWRDTRSLAATSEDLDLGGSLTDGLGDTLTIAKIRSLTIKNNNTTTGHTLSVGGATANAISTLFAATTDIVVIQPNGLLHIEAPTDGYAVTTATADLLKIDAGAVTISYDIIVIGTSA